MHAYPAELFHQLFDPIPGKQVPYFTKRYNDHILIVNYDCRVNIAAKRLYLVLLMMIKTVLRNILFKVLIY